jgi:Beta-ketoacyl synthase, N-terminal domain
VSNPRRIPTLSSTTGELLESSTLHSALKAALTQILIEPIRWTAVGDGVALVLQNIGSPEFTVQSVGTSAEQTLYSVLEKLQQASKLKLPPTGRPVVPTKPQRLSQSPTEYEAGRPEKSKIAIIGMSGRFPESNNNEAFWKLLYAGLDVHKEVPTFHHWDAKTHVDVTGKAKNTSATPFGCWLDNPAAFDARFFNMSPREAPQVDPAQRIALLTAYEAIEQAGVVPGATPSTQKDRVGVFYGVTSNDWMETNSAQDIDTYFIPGGNRAFIPGRINYFFKFSGPSYSVDTACSSSLAAIHVACNSLWRGDIDTAIAGGTNVLTNPDFTAGLDRGHFLSRTGNCKTFDDGADGYCRYVI